ncbi:GTPase-activating protein gyp8 [Rhizoctonia solani]
MTLEKIQRQGSFSKDVYDEKRSMNNVTSEPQTRVARDQAIREAVERKDWYSLREMSNRPGGFQGTRSVAWPFLLHVASASRGSSEKKEKEENSRDGQSSSTRVPHRDERQVGLDTNRAFVHYPVESQQHKEKRKKQLTELILGVLERRPQLSYFQGYHDILSTLQLTLHPSLDKDTEAWQLLQECAIKITLHRARDAMGAGLEPLTGQLRILRRLIRLADPDLAILIEEASPLPYWAISPLMTLYTHDLPTLALAQRVMDWMLARPPNAVIYLVAAFVLQKKEEIQKLVEDGDDGMMHSFLSSLPDLEADELPEPVDTQENDQSSSTHAPFNSDLLTLNSDVPSDVDSSRDDLTSSLVSVQPPSYTEKASQLPASSLDELQDSPNQPTGLNPPAPPSPASSLSSLPPELPNIDHQSGPTVPLSQILQAADRLRTRYPISYEKLRLKETLGPHSMLRTWSEDPDEIIGDDEAEEYVLATDQIVYPDLDDDVFEPYPPPQPVKLSKTRTLLARLPKIDMMAYAAFGLVAVAVVANSPTAREHTKRLAEFILAKFTLPIE